jgi:hypothetical protein
MDTATAGRVRIEWVPCPRCGQPVCDYGDFVVDTDRAGQALDVEHECSNQ